MDEANCSFRGELTGVVRIFELIVVGAVCNDDSCYCPANPYAYYEVVIHC